MVKKSKRNANKPKRSVSQKQNRAKTMQPRAQARLGPPAGGFGPVSTINTAPVAIGNSLRGAQTQVLQTAGGVRVIGRDYVLASLGNGTATNWTCGGGMPITPACLPTTILRNFVNMYNKFKINKLVFHFITATTTNQTGDIVFYYQKSANSPQLNWTDGTFLPYVLSDSMSVIGPQWTNHSIEVVPKTSWLTCDYGMAQDQEAQAAGDLFLFTKSSTSSSTGYLIIDYDISFNTLSMTPRLGVIPTSSALWNPASLAYTFVTSGATGTNAVSNATSGTAFIGGTTITAAVFVLGRVYKVFIDATNSTFTTPNTAATWFKVGYGGTAAAGATAGTNSTNAVETAIALVDGYTFYAVALSTSTVTFFSEFEAAVAGYNAWTFAAATGTTYAGTLCIYYKLVGYQGGTNTQYTTQVNA
jgi:hypothetical protein